MTKPGFPLRRVQCPATIDWNLATTAYFKSGRRPWRLARVRDRVSSVGLVFKQVPNAAEGSACCGAQMFLDSGDGLVFKGGASVTGGQQLPRNTTLPRLVPGPSLRGY